MRSAERVVVAARTSVAEAIRVLDTGELGLALVCDEGQRLLGIVTDVDVRKGLMRGMRLEDPVETIMNRRPTVATPEAAREDLLTLMHRTGIRQIPVVDLDGRVLGVEILKDIGAVTERETEVVIMAGGRGQRLRPLTDAVPKPMLPVGGRPLMEILVERLCRQGFTRLRVALNYRGEVIERHFGDGRKWGAEITYLREREPQGTAGALALLDPRPKRPFLVVNGDLLTNLNFEHLVDYHEAHGGAATMCAKEYELQLPFGVVEVQAGAVAGIREKPVSTFQINAGVYVIDPDTLALIGAATHLDMTELLARALARGLHVNCFPVREQWIDIGSEADYHRALGESGDADE